MNYSKTIEQIRQNIEKTKNNNRLFVDNSTLLAASKAQPVDRITQCIEAGITDFGENRVQEAQEKWPDIKKRFTDIRLHLIGPLQTNKVKQALSLFDVIQTIDRPKLAEAIAGELSDHPSSLTAHRFFIQVNSGKEPQKAGVMPEDADQLIRYCRDDLRLPVVGLMCIPPAEHPPAPYFAQLRAIAQRNGLKELSMGMSDDYETAMRMGSSCIRLGRALFGERV